METRAVPTATLTWTTAIAGVRVRRAARAASGVHRARIESADLTDLQPAEYRADLVVLSAMAHGNDQDPEKKALKIALSAMGASVGLDAERSTLYFDLVVASLSEAARRTLQAMDPAKYEYQSEFAKRYVAQGVAQGEAKGRAAVSA